jgi:sugar phosphate isomerase/epimerase
MGFEAIHLSSGEVDGDPAERLDDAGLRERYLKAARDAGVAITALAPGDLNDLGITSPPGSGNAAKVAESIGIAIEAAAAMDVPLVFLPSFRAGEIHDDSDLERTAAVLAGACDAAAGRVTIATENTLGADDNLRLLAAAGRSDLRILLDTQNPFLWGHRVASMVDPLWQHLVAQVHVKDGRGGDMGNAVLGEGESGFLETAEAMRACGFAGVAISENDYHGARSAAAASDIAVARRALGT